MCNMVKYADSDSSFKIRSYHTYHYPSVWAASQNCSINDSFSKQREMSQVLHIWRPPLLLRLCMIATHLTSAHSKPSNLLLAWHYICVSHSPRPRMICDINKTLQMPSINIHLKITLNILEPSKRVWVCDVCSVLRAAADGGRRAVTLQSCSRDGRDPEVSGSHTVLQLHSSSDVRLHICKYSSCLTHTFVCVHYINIIFYIFHLLFISFNLKVYVLMFKMKTKVNFKPNFFVTKFLKGWLFTKLWIKSTIIKIKH